MIEKGALLPMFYLPPVDYFTQLNRYKPELWIEQYEHFPKQTYRNRANIYSPDGTLTLVVPVVKGSKVHTPVKDVRISYDFDWQRLHWLSLQACYRRSAYFEYYEDDFAPFYEQQTTYLFDYNRQLLELLIRLLKIKTPFNYTDEYENLYPETVVDFRHSMNGKKRRSD